MARKSIIELIARARGQTETELLTELVSTHPDQMGMAADLGVSQSAVSEALNRNGFVLKTQWVAEEEDAEEKASA